MAHTVAEGKLAEMRKQEEDVGHEAAWEHLSYQEQGTYASSYL